MTTNTGQLRILYSFPDTLGAPGIGTTALQQVRGLVRRGHAVSVCATFAAQPVEGLQRLETTLGLAGRRIPHRSVGRRRAYRHHDRRTARMLERLHGSIDVVHCWPRGTLETAAAARRLGIPSIRELPNAHTAYAYEVVARELDRLGLPSASGHSHSFDAEALALEEREFAAATRLAAPSEFVRRTFLERGYPASAVARHHYGFEPSRFPAGDDRRRGRAGLQALFLGRCEPRKGLHHALRAWIDSGNAEHGRFVIVGDFYPGYRDLLAPLLAHPGVEVHGFTSDPGAVMRESDVFVLPTVEEGSALVTYEAQASGCVLAVSDAAGAACEHLRQGLVHPAGDVATLTGHLRLLASDPALLDRLRRATLDRRDELTWDAAAGALEAVYLDVLGAAREEAPARRIEVST